MKCDSCGKESDSFFEYEGATLCSSCYKAVKRKEAGETLWIERMRVSTQT